MFLRREGGQSLSVQVLTKTLSERTYSTLLKLALPIFSLVGEGTSDVKSYFLQTESSEWDRIDLTECVEDRSTVYLCYSVGVSSIVLILCQYVRTYHISCMCTGHIRVTNSK